MTGVKTQSSPNVFFNYKLIPFDFIDFTSDLMDIQ
jgi:hypothetical protein